MKVEALYQDINFKENDVIVFGCSYGPDSMALFKSLLLLKEKENVQLVCAHVHHGKRKESDQEKEALEAYCKKHHVVFEYMKIERYGDDNFHNEARNIRYRFFEQLAEKYRATYIMTAHHADDLMETILMRIVRGSTLEGYSGFKKKSHLGKYILYRPLIECTKQELLDFDRKYHIPYALDISNESSVYTRNRYRKVVLPFLKQEDGFVHEKFLKFSKSLQEADEYIKNQTEKVLKNVVHQHQLSISEFLKQENFIQKRILEEMLHAFYQDDLILISEKHIYLLLKLIKSKRSNASIYLPNEVLAVKEYNILTLKKHVDIITSYEIEINDYVELPNHHILKIVTESTDNSNFVTKLSSHEVKLPLRVRTREVGDIIAMKGGGHKKVKDIFIDKKVSMKERDLWPIVVDANNHIVFIPGLKKSKFDRKKDESYDIILRYE